MNSKYLSIFIIKSIFISLLFHFQFANISYGQTGENYASELLGNLEKSLDNSVYNYRLKLISDLNNSQNPANKIEILKSLLLYDVENDQIAVLDQHVVELLNLSTKANDNIGIVTAKLFEVYSGYYKNGNEDLLERLNAISELRAEYNDTNNDILHHILLSISLAIKGDFYGSLEELNLALLLKGHGKFGGELKLATYWTVAYLNSELSDVEGTISFYTKAYNFSVDNNLPINIRTAAYNVGISLFELGEFEKAEAYFEYYKKTVEIIDSQSELMSAYYSLANIENRMLNYEKSHEYFLKIEDYFPVGSWHYINSLQIEALNLASLGELEKAQEYIEVTKQYFHDNPLMDFPNQNWAVHRADAEIYFQKGELEQAKKLMDENQNNIMIWVNKKTSKELIKALNQIDEGIRERAKQEANDLAAEKRSELIVQGASGFILLLGIGSILQLRSTINLRKAKKAAEKESLYKSDFLANMSHELRTPLNAIIGYSDLMTNELMQDISEEKKTEYLNDINASGLHLLQVINDILDISKIASGKMEIHEIDIDLEKMLSDVYSILWPSLSKKKQKCLIRISPNLPFLLGDKKFIKQSLINLISNAHKYSEQNTNIVVSADINQKNEIHITIADNGIGMSEAEIKLAMQPFSQVKSAYVKSETGTGLGLPIVSELIGLHQGKLEINSIKENGTVVEITFPSHRTIMQNELSVIAK